MPYDAIVRCCAAALLALAPPYTPLAVHINATTSIALTLVQNAGACTLVNTGTNFAAMDLGSADNANATSCATYTPRRTYKLATTFSFEATCSGTCTNFHLSAALASAAQKGVTWRVGGKKLTTSAQIVSSNRTYGAAHSIALTVTVSTRGRGAAPAGAIQQAIAFTATANGVTGVSAAATLNAQFINRPGISIFFVQDANGAPVSGGAFDAGLNFGIVSAFGALPPGVTRSNVTSSSYTLQTPVDVNVESSGITSGSYTMSAALAAAAPAGLQYTVDAVTLSTTAATVTTSGSYGANQAYTLGLIVSTAAPGSGGPAIGSPLAETIDFTATAN